MSNPKMSNEVLIRSKKALTGLQFLLRQEGEFMYFSTNENLRLLATAETIYVDGTFEICPRLFYQVFTINAFVHGQQFPLVYGLLPWFDGHFRPHMWNYYRHCGTRTNNYRGWHNHMKREEEKGD